MSAAGPNGTACASGSGPLPADRVVGATPVLKEPRLGAGRLFWLEQLPEQRGRTTLRLRTAAGQELDLTPELDLRSRIHGYGGGTWCLAGDTAVVVAEGGRSLWRLDLAGAISAGVCGNAEPHAAGLSSPGAVAMGEAAGSQAAALPEPSRLIPETGSGQVSSSGEPALFADGLIDLSRQRWIGVCERDGRDRLVTVPLAGGHPRVLWESPDFCGYAVLSPSGSHLAWVSWTQPCMPWDRSQLWLGRFDGGGELVDARPIAGSAPGDERAISVFQPLWAGPDLVISSDRSGFWNLEGLADAERLAGTAVPSWLPLLAMPAEFGMPQWVYGMRTTAWDGRRLLAACCREGRWQLGALVPDRTAVPDHDPATPVRGAPAGGGHKADGENEKQQGIAAATSAQAGSPDAATRGRISSAASTGPAGAGAGALRWQPIPLPFDDLAALEAERGRLVAIASGPLDGPGLLELTLNPGAGPEPLEEGAAAAGSTQAHGRWRHRPAAPPLLARDEISCAEPLWFPGHGGRPTHAWYTPPRGGASRAAPLLVRGHSGPTAMARTGLSLPIQFWTSRGWGVVDVNYGGSTGFGRAYRERLDGGWGMVDVDDCLAAARALVASGRADPERIAMEGSSASGFTVLAAMAQGDTIRAGAIRYPVTDLTALAEGDHRFEARYFDALVGPWPEARPIYEQRSPLNQVERINAPLLFFHGLDDTVVPAQQSIAMVERLKQRGVPVELVLFEGEGHGFRDAAVQLQVLERSEAFFRRQFDLPEPA